MEGWNVTQKDEREAKQEEFDNILVVGSESNNLFTGIYKKTKEKVYLFKSPLIDLKYIFEFMQNYSNAKCDNLLPIFKFYLFPNFTFIIKAPINGKPLPIIINEISEEIKLSILLQIIDTVRIFQNLNYYSIFFDLNGIIVDEQNNYKVQFCSFFPIYISQNSISDFQMNAELIYSTMIKLLGSEKASFYFDKSNFYQSASKILYNFIQKITKSQPKMNVDVSKYQNYFNDLIELANKPNSDPQIPNEETKILEAQYLCAISGINDKKYLPILAKKNHPKGLFLYGYRMFHGIGVRKDQIHGAKYIKSAADALYPEAQFYYSNLLKLGEGVRQNMNQSMNYLKFASDKKYKEALVLYGHSLSNTMPAIATVCYKEAAARGSFEGFFYNLFASHKNNFNSEKKIDNCLSTINFNLTFSTNIPIYKNIFKNQLKSISLGYLKLSVEFNSKDSWSQFLYGFFYEQIQSIFLNPNLNKPFDMKSIYESKDENSNNKNKEKEEIYLKESMENGNAFSTYVYAKILDEKNQLKMIFDYLKNENDSEYKNLKYFYARCLKSIKSSNISKIDDIIFEASKGGCYEAMNEEGLMLLNDDKKTAMTKIFQAAKSGLNSACLRYGKYIIKNNKKKGKHFLKLASRRFPEAEFILSHYSKNINGQMRHLKKAADNGYVKAYHLYGLAKYNEGDYTTAMQYFKKSNDAQSNLSYLYLASCIFLKCHEKNSEDSKKQTKTNEYAQIIHSAAQLKVQQANLPYGICLYYGIGVKKDEEKAQQYFHNSFISLDFLGIYNFAICMNEGIGMTPASQSDTYSFLINQKNIAEKKKKSNDDSIRDKKEHNFSVVLFESNTDLGLSYIYLYLGYFLYLKGSLKEAKSYFKTSALNGNMMAAILFAKCIEQNSSIPEKLFKALRIYHLVVQTLSTKQYANFPYACEIRRKAEICEGLLKIKLKMKDSIQQLKKVADEGDSQAQFFYGAYCMGVDIFNKKNSTKYDLSEYLKKISKNYSINQNNQSSKYGSMFKNVNFSSSTNNNNINSNSSVHISNVTSGFGSSNNNNNNMTLGFNADSNVRTSTLNFKSGTTSSTFNGNSTNRNPTLSVTNNTAFASSGFGANANSGTSDFRGIGPMNTSSSSLNNNTSGLYNNNNTRNTTLGFYYNSNNPFSSSTINNNSGFHNNSTSNSTLGFNNSNSINTNSGFNNANNTSNATPSFGISTPPKYNSPGLNNTNNISNATPSFCISTPPNNSNNLGFNNTNNTSNATPSFCISTPPNNNNSGFNTNNTSNATSSFGISTPPPNNNNSGFNNNNTSNTSLGFGYGASNSNSGFNASNTINNNTGFNNNNNTSNSALSFNNSNASNATSGFSNLSNTTNNTSGFNNSNASNATSGFSNLSTTNNASGFNNNSNTSNTTSGFNNGASNSTPAFNASNTTNNTSGFNNSSTSNAISSFSNNSNITSYNYDTSLDHRNFINSRFSDVQPPKYQGYTSTFRFYNPSNNSADSNLLSFNYNESNGSSNLSTRPTQTDENNSNSNTIRLNNMGFFQSSSNKLSPSSNNSWGCGFSGEIRKINFGQNSLSKNASMEASRFNFGSSNKEELRLNPTSSNNSTNFSLNPTPSNRNTENFSLNPISSNSNTSFGINSTASNNNTNFSLNPTPSNNNTNFGLNSTSPNNKENISLNPTPSNNNTNSDQNSSNTNNKSPLFNYGSNNRYDFSFGSSNNKENSCFNQTSSNNNTNFGLNSTSPNNKENFSLNPTPLNNSTNFGMSSSLPNNKENISLNPTPLNNNTNSDQNSSNTNTNNKSPLFNYGSNNRYDFSFGSSNNSTNFSLNPTSSSQNPGFSFSQGASKPNPSFTFKLDSENDSNSRFTPDPTSPDKNANFGSNSTASNSSTNSGLSSASSSRNESFGLNPTSSNKSSGFNFSFSQGASKPSTGFTFKLDAGNDSHFRFGFSPPDSSSNAGLKNSLDSSGSGVLGLHSGQAGGTKSSGSFSLNPRSTGSEDINSNGSSTFGINQPVASGSSNAILGQSDSAKRSGSFSLNQRPTGSEDGRGNGSSTFGINQPVASVSSNAILGQSDSAKSSDSFSLNPRPTGSASFGQAAASNGSSSFGFNSTALSDNSSSIFGQFTGRSGGADPAQSGNQQSNIKASPIIQQVPLASSTRNYEFSFPGSRAIQPASTSGGSFRPNHTDSGVAQAQGSSITTSSSQPSQNVILPDFTTSNSTNIPQPNPTTTTTKAATTTKTEAATEASNKIHVSNADESLNASECNKAEGIRYLEASAASGNDRAEEFLARCLLKGDGVERDGARAVSLFLSSSSKGNAQAKNNLGYLHKKGLFVAQDDEAAFDLFKAAAEGGSAMGRLHYSMCLMKGRGTKMNISQALVGLKKAREMGIPRASYVLGLYYINYDPNGRDEGLKLMREAAYLGYKKANFLIGI